MLAASQIEQIVRDLENTGRSVLTQAVPETVVRLLAVDARARQSGAFRAAAIGAGRDQAQRPEIRNDRIAWIDPGVSTPGCQHWLAGMESLRQALNARLQLGLFEFETHFAAYAAGGFYRRHLDQLRGDSSRIVTVILYLNEDWRPADGGCLRMYIPGADGETSSDILPQGGTLVTFLSGEFPHEVLPAGRERLSVTGWFKTRPPVPR